MIKFLTSATHGASMNKNVKHFSWRVLVYLLGFVIQTFGLTLNSKTGLGNTPITALCFVTAKIIDISLGQGVFLIYVFMLLIQILLLRKKFQKVRLLQLVAGMIGSLLISFYDFILPECTTPLFQWGGLILATVTVGIGASLIVGMRLLPNPADGLSDIVGNIFGKDFGFGKNFLDASCVIISGVAGFLFSGELIGVGIGTLFSTIFTGRVASLMRPLCEKIYARVGFSDYTENEKSPEMRNHLHKKTNKRSLVFHFVNKLWKTFCL